MGVGVFRLVWWTIAPLNIVVQILAIPRNQLGKKPADIFQQSRLVFVDNNCRCGVPGINQNEAVDNTALIDNRLNLWRDITQADISVRGQF